mmetsp:Transcript_2215/g.5150  ORF Transcript_2215/g.5150 Transcript_2215/m.5150 type:complete len:237 (-) Transcript_2215:1785-2495(-)
MLSGCRPPARNRGIVDEAATAMCQSNVRPVPPRAAASFVSRRHKAGPVGHIPSVSAAVRASGVMSFPTWTALITQRSGKFSAACIPSRPESCTTSSPTCLAMLATSSGGWSAKTPTTSGPREHLSRRVSAAVWYCPLPDQAPTPAGPPPLTDRAWRACVIWRATSVDTWRDDLANTSPIKSAPAFAVATAVGTSLRPQILTRVPVPRPCSSRILAAGSAARINDSPTKTALAPHVV